MGFTYVDAAKMMGAHGGRTVAALERLTGGVLLAASVANPVFVLNLFEAKSELARLSGELAREIGDRVHGLDRYSRSDRFAAAHSVLALAAFFEALGEAKLPVRGRDLAFTRAEQVELAGGGETEPGRLLGALVGGLLRTEVPMPSPQQPTEMTREAMRVFYRGLSGELTRFVARRPAWEALDAVARQRFAAVISDEVPRQAVDRYKERLQQMALQFPEVAFLLNAVDHQATREQVRQLDRKMTELAGMLDALVAGREPDRDRQALAWAYAAALERPVLTSSDTPQGLRLPSLGESYVMPFYRAIEATGEAARRLSDESWWKDQAVRGDLVRFLFGYLVSPQAVSTPLVVLGQPGSGKSVLTQMLAAQLPPDRFLVVRVPLREVAADSDLQAQIEDAVRSATAQRVQWPDLVESANSADSPHEVLPLVLLDGFDELLQATGVSQTDYLDRIARFQLREQSQHRPVAVVITSRTAVADRAAVPPGTVVLRLEPFGEAQITQWLEVWNQTNSGIPPLQAQVVLQHPELASQPLLLIMLALYYADENRLQRAVLGRDEDAPDSHQSAVLGEADLYERLLYTFARREIEKSEAGLTYQEIDRRVDRELRRLSVVAMGMFSRSRHWVSESELDADLPALLGSPSGQVAPGNFRAALTDAQVIVGRFFFIHVSQATRDNVQSHTYEFLHATFGEYLIARLVTRELVYVADVARHSARSDRPQALDDSLLYALLSYMPLTTRGTIVSFIAESLHGISRDRRQDIHDVLLNLHHRALQERRDTSYSDYKPLPLTLTARLAAYSANLLVLTVLSSGGEVTGSSLFPDAQDPVKEWRSRAMLWRSQLPEEGWGGILDFITLDRVWISDRSGKTVKRDIVLSYDRGAGQRVGDFDPYWSYNRADTDEYRLAGRPFGWSHLSDSTLHGQAWFVCDEDDDTVMHALDPFKKELNGIIASFHSYWEDGRSISTANAFNAMLLKAVNSRSPQQLAEAYDDCIEIIIRARLGSDTNAIRQGVRRMVLMKLAQDRRHLPAEWLAKVMRRIRESVGQDTSEVYFADELVRIAREALPDLMEDSVAASDAVTAADRGASSEPTASQ